MEKIGITAREELVQMFRFANDVVLITKNEKDKDGIKRNAEEF